MSRVQYLGSEPLQPPLLPPEGAPRGEHLLPVWWQALQEQPHHKVWRVPAPSRDVVHHFLDDHGPALGHQEVGCLPFQDLAGSPLDVTGSGLHVYLVSLDVGWLEGFFGDFMCTALTCDWRL